jgi:beta-lactamase regulating signal transducer with metallopeptidase domain
MTSYLIYSSVSLAVLLLFYRFFLEKEKRFTLNRAFLIWSLIFSFTIPIIPVGLELAEMPWEGMFSNGDAETTDYVIAEGLRIDSEIQAVSAESGSVVISSRMLYTIVFLIYASISVLLFVRLIRIIHRIQLKISRNSKRLIEGCEVVLLNEKVVPHTFINTIFLNKKQFESGEIPDEVLNHEITHARQKHSLDILFVEFLKIIFWFNPLLYFYKHAIALNHEYLADKAVISKGAAIKNYQRILLKTMEGSAIPGLVSSLNFSLTKRRLQMMTQSKTRVKFLLKLTMLLPLFAGLSLMLGCEPATNEVSEETETVDEIRIEILDDNALLVNEKRMTLDELESYLSDLPESPELVRMKVSPDAEFGTIADVQTILRKYDALRINYSTESDGEPDSLEKVTDRFLKAAERYMNIDPDSMSEEELQREYEIVTELYEEILNFENKDPQSPPPPPLVPSPEKRLENSGDLTLPPAPPAPPAPVEEGDLMQILMNSQGMLLMNEEPAELDEVRQNIKQFVETGASTPSRAVVSIKTVPDTPYDQYLELLDEIRAAYSEMRNEAAQNQFGRSYASLQENSSEMARIKEAYPMKLSIVPPETENQEIMSTDEVQNLKSIMDKAKEERSQAYNEFVNLDYQNISKENLENAYSELREISMKSYDAEVAYHQAIGEQVPPPPPIPQKPAKLENQ